MRTRPERARNDAAYCALLDVGISGTWDHAVFDGSRLMVTDVCSAKCGSYNSASGLREETVSASGSKFMETAEACGVLVR